MILTEYSHFMKKLVPAILVAMFCTAHSAVWSADDPPILEASSNGDLGKVKSLIEAEANINAKNKDGNTPLHLAAREGHENVVKLLVEAGVDIKAKDKYGNTPLHFAAREGNENMAKLLVDAKAGVNKKNSIGDTPLHFAAGRGHEDVARFLVEAGADVKAKDSWGSTPLDAATRNGHGEVAEFLMNAGENVRANNNGSVPEESRFWDIYFGAGLTYSNTDCAGDLRDGVDLGGTTHTAMASGICNEKVGYQFHVGADYTYGGFFLGAEIGHAETGIDSSYRDGTVQTMDPNPMDIAGATVTGRGNTEFSTFFAGLRFGPRLMFMDKPLSPYFRIGLHSHDIELISAHIVATDLPPKLVPL